MAETSRGENVRGSLQIFIHITFQISMAYHTRDHEFMIHEWRLFRTRQGWRFLYTHQCSVALHDSVLVGVQNPEESELYSAVRV